MRRPRLTGIVYKSLAAASVALALTSPLACDGGSTGGGSTGGDATAGPPADGYQGPPRGQWQGDLLDFTVTTGSIEAIALHDVSCKSVAKHCTDDLDDQLFTTGLGIEPRTNASGSTEWHLVGDLGPVTKIDGIFMPLEAEPWAFTSVQGTLTFVSDSCACDKTTFFWSTSFVPPKDPNAPDAGGGGGPGGAVPDDATPEQIKALERVNWYRDQLGIPLVDLNASLNSMASDHCSCYWSHVTEYQTSGMSPHSEDPSWDPPCYGDLGARASEHGVSLGGGVSEVMAFMNNPTKAVDGWIATLYHRIPLTDPGTTAIGYGAANQCDTINSTGGASSSDWEVVYPYDGQQDADLSWDGAESPQPPPPPGGYPSGPIITIQFGGGVTFSILKSSIVDEAGMEVSHTLLTPKNDSNLAGSPTASLYSDKPLQPETTYTVSLEGTRVNQPWTKTWSFRTAPKGGGSFWP